MTVPHYKKIDAQVALDTAKYVVVRLRAMRNAKTMQEFNELRNALAIDLNNLNFKTQTL